MKAVKGASDILPKESQTFCYIEDVARSVFEVYEYREIRTPIFENTELFERSVGAETDIVT
jgi:histidyl-tRNA synthetase